MVDSANTCTTFAPRPRFAWRLRNRIVALGERTLLMGVLNVTPDSFSDGGLHLSPQAAIAHGLALLADGADILDIGGESTRPGSSFISAEQELSRILPVISAIRRARPDAILSVDTYKSLVAREAVAAGADILNDVSGLTWNNDMAATCADLNCGIVVMHTRGQPSGWKQLPPIPTDDVLPLVRDGLADSLHLAHAAGIRDDAIVLDPGFGFGKRGEENFTLLARMSQLAQLGRPLLAGVSRKSFLRDAITGQEQDIAALTARLDQASAAAGLAAVLAGAHIVRVHSVIATRSAVAFADALLHSL